MHQKNLRASIDNDIARGIEISAAEWETMMNSICNLVNKRDERIWTKNDDFETSNVRKKTTQVLIGARSFFSGYTDIGGD